MSAVIIGNNPVTMPLTYGPPLVEIAKTFGGNWDFDPLLSLTHLEMHAGSSQVSTIDLTYRYGNTIYPGETTFTPRKARELIGQWVRVSAAGEQGLITMFVGQIEGHSTDLLGSASNPAGIMKFSAAGGLRFLEKIVIATSQFLPENATDETKPVTVGWIPAMNKRDKRGLLVGNMNSQGGTSFYGGTDTWTHLDYLNYMLAAFIQQTGDSVPNWTVGGQSDILDDLQTTIDFGASISALDVLRKLIPVKYGLDFSVIPTDDGYEINVFAMTAKNTTISGVTMPSNPNTTTIQKDQQIDLIDCQVVTTTERRVDKVQVLGKRIVVCGTLYGQRAVAADGQATLVPKWGAAIETDYIAAGGMIAASPTAGSDAFDRARKREKYREVYTHFGAPDGWDLDGGTWAMQCRPDGTLTTGASQDTVRETLSWTPMKTGWDYSTDPPTDNTLGSNTSDEEPVRPPMAWILDERYNGNQPAPHYVACDSVGIHLHHPYQDWGIIATASPQYFLARNHLTESQLYTFDFELDQIFDYDTLVATIAIESDWRLSLSYTVPSEMSAGDGSVMTIVDEEAECWVLLPNTVVDINTSYTAVDPDSPADESDSDVQPVDQTQWLTSGPNQRILRNDSDRLSLLLAGAVSKYINERGRAVLTFRGLMPWAKLIGTILTAVQQGDNVQPVGAPITSLIWDIPDSESHEGLPPAQIAAPTAVVRTGYA